MILETELITTTAFMDTYESALYDVEVEDNYANAMFGSLFDVLDDFNEEFLAEDQEDDVTGVDPLDEALT